MHLPQSKSVPGPSLKVNNVGSLRKQPMYLNYFVVKSQYVLQVLIIRAEVCYRRQPWFLGVKTQGIGIKSTKPGHSFVGRQPGVIEGNPSVNAETESKLSVVGIQMYQVTNAPSCQAFIQPFICIDDYLHSIVLDLTVTNVGHPSEESNQVQHVIAQLTQVR